MNSLTMISNFQTLDYNISSQFSLFVPGKGSDDIAPPSVEPPVNNVPPCSPVETILNLLRSASLNKWYVAAFLCMRACNLITAASFEVSMEQYFQQPLFEVKPTSDGRITVKIGDDGLLSIINKIRNDRPFVRALFLNTRMLRWITESKSNGYLFENILVTFLLLSPHPLQGTLYKGKGSNTMASSRGVDSALGRSTGAIASTWAHSIESKDRNAGPEVDECISNDDTPKIIRQGKTVYIYRGNDAIEVQLEEGQSMKQAVKKQRLLFIESNALQRVVVFVPYADNHAGYDTLLDLRDSTPATVPNTFAAVCSSYSHKEGSVCGILYDPSNCLC